MPRWTALAASVLLLLAAATSSGAQDRVKEAKASFIFNGERIKISRDNPDAVGFALQLASAGVQCGEPCIAPMQAAPGVKTFGEVEVLDFLVAEVANNRGLMVDARAPQDHATGFIPGTVSLPHSALAQSNTFRDDILRALGARETDGTFDFADVRSLLVYDSGPSSNDAGVLVNNLLGAGYPPKKISYYRGGMQVWSVLGFSIEEGHP